MPNDKDSIEKLVNDASFTRWVKGQATNTERKRWDRWVMKNHRNRRLAMKAQEQIEGFAIKPGDAPDPATSWHRLQKQLDEIPKIRKYPFRASLKNTNTERFVWFVRAAAVILLAAVTGILVTQMYNPTSEVSAYRTNKVQTKTGEQKTVTFHDGSEVILNGNSSMTYITNRYDPYSIEVHLQGEAYFSVKSRKSEDQSPFLVQTGQGIVSVLGTRFMVSTWANQTRVVLENGRVSLKSVHLDTESILEPGELGEFSGPDGSIRTQLVNTDVYTSWIYGRLTFEKTPFAEVVRRLENTFGVRIEVRDRSIMENRISGSIESSELEVIISALSKMLDTPIYDSDEKDMIYVGKLKDM